MPNFSERAVRPVTPERNLNQSLHDCVDVTELIEAELGRRANICLLGSQPGQPIGLPLGDPFCLRCANKRCTPVQVADVELMSAASIGQALQPEFTDGFKQPI